jgi:hypothetical protein
MKQRFSLYTYIILILSLLNVFAVFVTGLVIVLVMYIVILLCKSIKSMIFYNINFHMNLNLLL